MGSLAFMFFSSSITSLNTTTPFSSKYFFASSSPMAKTGGVKVVRVSACFCFLKSSLYGAGELDVALCCAEDEEEEEESIPSLPATLPQPAQYRQLP
jgi:hypothetical protein